MKNLIIHKSVYILFFVFMSLKLWPQESKKYSHNALAEKIYLQLDNEVYTNNKTIWFKAIVLNATTHEPNVSSGVLYVDLIDSEKQIIESKLIKLSQGIGSGFFDLDRSYIEGSYLIRAHTEWNKNFDSDFIFEKYIQIFEAKEVQNINNPIQNIRRVDTTITDQHFKIDFYPELIDVAHRRALTVIITEDGKQDTIAIKRNQEKQYVLERTIPKTVQLVQLEIKTKNNFSYRTSFSPNVNYLDLQFFPESGKMIAGLPSKIGFKAIGPNGKGQRVEGEILNADNEIISTFKSNALGMGSFIIDKVDSEQYTARLKSKTVEKEIVLPKVVVQGYALTVSKNDNKINVLAQSNYLTNSEITLRVTCRGYEYYNIQASLVNGRFTYKFPTDELPEGIIAFTLLDKNRIPLAERLYFNERKDDRLMIDAKLNKTEYAKREKVDVTISIKDSEAKTMNASTSVLVLNAEDYEEAQDIRQNILSYFLLNSDVRGKIESPGLYFTPNSELDIDDLMLTQGWRNYKYTNPIQKLNYKREHGLAVSGTIKFKKPQSKNKEIDLMLMTFGDSSQLYSGKVFVPSRFSFELGDLYGDTKDIIIQSLNQKDNKKKNYSITLTKKKELPVEYNYSNTSVISDSIVKNIVAENRNQKIKEDQYYFANTGATQLDEVIVKGYKLTPKRKEVNDRFGDPDVVIDGKKIKEKEKKWSYGLYSVLLFNYPDKINIVRRRDGNLFAVSTKGGRDHVTLVVVDGIPVNWGDYSLIQNISIDEVTSFEIIENANNIKQLVAEVFNTVPPRGPLTGSVIAIYTKRGKGLHGAVGNKKGIDVNQIEVFSTQKEFYAPKHDIDNSEDILQDPDLRSLIYWNPNVTFDKDGEQNVSYYHSDNMGKFIIVLESISESGKIGYKKIDYNVIDQYINEN